MKTKLFYAGAISLGIAAAFALLDLTTIKTSFSETIMANITIYPATFFALLGLLLMHFGVKPLWRIGMFLIQLVLLN